MAGGVRSKEPHAGEIGVIVCRIGERVNRVKRLLIFLVLILSGLALIVAATNGSAISVMQFVHDGVRAEGAIVTRQQPNRLCECAGSLHTCTAHARCVPDAL